MLQFCRPKIFLFLPFCILWIFDKPIAIYYTYRAYYYFVYLEYWNPNYSDSTNRYILVEEFANITQGTRVKSLEMNYIL